MNIKTLAHTRTKKTNSFMLWKIKIDVFRKNTLICAREKLFTCSHGKVIFLLFNALSCERACERLISSFTSFTYNCLQVYVFTEQRLLVSILFVKHIWNTSIYYILKLFYTLTKPINCWFICWHSPNQDHQALT